VRISGKPSDQPSVVAKVNNTKEEEKPVLTAKGGVVYVPVSEIEALRKKKHEEFEAAQKAKQEAEKKAKEEAKKDQSFTAFSGTGFRLK